MKIRKFSDEDIGMSRHEVFSQPKLQQKQTDNNDHEPSSSLLYPSSTFSCTSNNTSLPHFMTQQPNNNDYPTTTSSPFHPHSSFSYTRVKSLKVKLEEFFGNWVFEWDFEKTELTKIVDGILYLPLSRPAYLEITSLIEQIHSEYEIIEDAVVLWKNKLIYNGSIPENQLKGIWKHLDTLISERNLFERELERKKNTKDSDKVMTISKIYFLTFAFLIPAKSVEGITKVYDMKFYISLDECLSIRSESIINAVNEDYEKSRKFGGLTITNEMAHALCDIHEDLEKHQQLTEVYTRSTTNFWVVGRRSDKRILYIVVPKKDTSLIEVEDEIRKLTSLYFSANNN
ncbi:23582_t:CDS:2 [Entrophospora sp. SA101]|nr:23582_t:CDS:2 [Entrophospora sp. SA101]